jgi:hypothetical protein
LHFQKKDELIFRLSVAYEVSKVAPFCIHTPAARGVARVRQIDERVRLERIVREAARAGAAGARHAEAMEGR